VHVVILNGLSKVKHHIKSTTTKKKDGKHQGMACDRNSVHTVSEAVHSLLPSVKLNSELASF